MINNNDSEINVKELPAEPINEPETNAEHKYNRALKREIDIHNTFLKELLMEYIKFKNKNFAEYEGYITHKADVKAKYSFLNFKWNQYCEKAKLSRKYKFNPGPKAFVEEVKKHNAAHAKLCWVNYMMRMIKAKFNIEPNAPRLAEIYREDYTPEDALTDIFCSHEINLEY